MKRHVRGLRIIGRQRQHLFMEDGEIHQYGLLYSVYIGYCGSYEPLSSKLRAENPLNSGIILVAT
jgi:hypothetical protein